MDVEIFIKRVEWDTEVDGFLTDPGLPTGGFTIVLDVEGETPDEVYDEVDERLADALSDEYGYCVYDVEWDYA